MRFQPKIDNYKPPILLPKEEEECCEAVERVPVMVPPKEEEWSSPEHPKTVRGPAPIPNNKLSYYRRQPANLLGYNKPVPAVRFIKGEEDEYDGNANMMGQLTLDHKQYLAKRERDVREAQHESKREYESRREQGLIKRERDLQEAIAVFQGMAYERDAELWAKKTKAE